MFKSHQKKALNVWVQCCIVIQSVTALKAKNWPGQEGFAPFMTRPFFAIQHCIALTDNLCDAVSKQNLHPLFPHK